MPGRYNFIVWMDYSIYLKLTEKNQVLSAHFSGRQQTLHDSRVQDGDQRVYVFHLSDDTNHDSVMTAYIIRGLINHYPQIIKDGQHVLESDHCSTQYKSKFLFAESIKIAKEHDISIILRFGEPGHGRGLMQ